MAELIYLDHMVSTSDRSNIYSDYFDSINGAGSNIGDVFISQPDFQRGYGINSSNYTNRVQLGHGIGSWLSSLYRFAKPYLKKRG